MVERIYDSKRAVNPFDCTVCIYTVRYVSTQNIVITISVTYIIVILIAKNWLNDASII